MHTEKRMMTQLLVVCQHIHIDCFQCSDQSNKMVLPKIVIVAIVRHL